MENFDFLSPQDGDNEATSELKHVTKQAIESDDIVAISHIKLMAAFSLIVRQKREDEAFLDLAGPFMDAAVNLYRDSVNYETLYGLQQVPEEDDERKLALVLGLSLLPSKILASEKILADLAKKLEKFLTKE